MNILSVSILIFFTFVNVSAKSEIELKRLANDLLTKISATLASMNNVKNNAKEVPQKLDKVKKSIDFHIPKDPKVIEVQKELEKHRGTANYVACNKINENNQQNLKKELADILTFNVTGYLKEINAIVNNIVKKLNFVAEHLKGKNLDEEIKLCINNEKQCRLTSNYKDEVDRHDKTAQFVNNMLLSLIDNTITKEINPIISGKINNQIYEPVIRCLNHVNKS